MIFEIHNHKHCVYCGEVVGLSTANLACKASNNPMVPMTNGEKAHVILGEFIPIITEPMKTI